MLVDFDETFRPWMKWEDKKLSNLNPCSECETFKKFHNIALYGSIGERQYAALPDSCRFCLDKIVWESSCLSKLRWYEDQDERLKGE